MAGGTMPNEFQRLEQAEGYRIMNDGPGRANGLKHRIPDSWERENKTTCATNCISCGKRDQEPFSRLLHRKASCGG